ncbi:MAG: 2-hydroxychromene-2-carboxylate isomerase [Proteobacteria bacterium]|nr:2-hydroxychromene-2-carboxylate isomerase [Pseudomonadota bacterium]MDA1295724.1 2-hydroxychromene-2-carboxylate isomerase [Pseudomonadota bacterium]
MSHIDYYFSTISPFSYLAGNRLEMIAAKHGASIAYKPMDVIALFARTGGEAPAERHPARQAYRLQELRRQSKKNKLALNLKPQYFPTNAAPSSYAVIAAQSDGSGDVGALVRALLASCWAEDKDVAQDSVIKNCLISAGFDPTLADSGLLAGAETYAKNLEDAVNNDVFGAPFYVVDGAENFWGQDRLSDLDAFLAGDL